MLPAIVLKSSDVKKRHFFANNKKTFSKLLLEKLIIDSLTVKFLSLSYIAIKKLALRKSHIFMSLKKHVRLQFCHHRV